jgi:predicted aspartyl protease
MITGKTVQLELSVDSNHQWFATMWVMLQGRKQEVRFKVDTGCNALVLSHNTLKSLGLSVKSTDLSKLPNETAKLASGEISSFKKLGEVSLYMDKSQSVLICNAQAICHATRATNDLMGTEVFRQFSGVNFNLITEKYMELRTGTV